MSWTAAVTAKNFVDGVVSVTVDYSDGVSAITETYQNSVPTATWIPDIVRDRIAQLEIAETFDIPIGPVTPSAPGVTDPDKALFQRRLRMLELADVLVNLQVIQLSNTKLQQLITWVQNNYDTYFIDGLYG